MRGFARSLPLGVSLLLAGLTPAQASNALLLPPAPQGPGGEDAIETAEGGRCRQSMNSNGPYLDAGAAGRAAAPQRQTDDRLIIYPNDRDSEAMAYVRVTIPLGRRAQRIDCTRMYELEIARMQREIELLRLAAE